MRAIESPKRAFLGALVFSLSLLPGSCRSSWTGNVDNIDYRRPGATLRTILDYECLRQKESLPAIAALLAHRDSVVRSWAVRALGRVGGEENTMLILEALGDKQKRVKSAAIFALGQMQQEGAAKKAEGALLTILGSADPELRASVLLALGKLLGPIQYTRILPFLTDRNAQVRGAASLALHNMRARALRTREPLPIGMDDSLSEALSVTIINEKDRSAHWRHVYALAALFHERSFDALMLAAESRLSESSRIFAIRGLAALFRDTGKVMGERRVLTARKLLMESLGDDSQSVVIEAAIALGDPSRKGNNSSVRDTAAPFEDQAVLEALRAILSHKNPQVAAAGIQAMGHFPNFLRSAEMILDVMIASSVPCIKAQAIEAKARLLGAKYRSQLEIHAHDESWPIRIAVARSLRFLPTRTALPLARRLLADDDGRVKIAVVTALEKHAENSEAVAIVERSLDIRDPAMREAAAAVLEKVGEIGDSALVTTLHRNYLDSVGPEFIDARQAIVKATATLGEGDPQGRSLLLTALQDASFGVRRQAHRALLRWGGKEVIPVLSRPDGTWIPHLPDAGQLGAFLSSRPRVQLTTNKGKIVIELWPAQAPAHCYNLLQLVSNKRYQDRPFHRVVRNFVIQGGDHRGDGSGARSFLGGRLRDEINERPFSRGTVGMPKSSEPDSGGEQIFITLIPTPHLDGRYTAFGEVVEGMDVVLSTEVGDKILEARILR